MIRRPLLILLLFFPCRWLAAGEIIVDSTGGGDFTTIQAAVDAALPGDCISIRAGTYAESVTLNRSGTEDAPVTIQAFGDGEVVLDGFDGTFEAAILAKGVHHITTRISP